jgi:hypothetical protein
MTSRKTWFWLSLAFALVVALPARALAQADTRIAGTVRDGSGSAVASAQVSVRNEKTGELRQTTTNQHGYFIIGNLKPSSYTVKVEMTNFAPLEYPQMDVRAAQELGLDFELKPAGIQESVTVQADATVVDASSARIGANVTQFEVNSLPINGRQMSQLVLQAPGSVNIGTGTWQDIRFSGRAVNQNVVKYDGIEGSAIIDASPGNLNGEVPTPFKLQASLENVQEFRVESSNFPAEYGTGTGGQINVVTKSGANAVRGALFEYIRNDKLDAPNYFDYSRNNDGSIKETLPKSMLRQHQFGGSIGGPIARDRAFFFGSYEGYRLKAGLNFVEAAPSDIAASRAVPAVAPLIAGFKSPNAVRLPGASSNPDFDIVQLQGVQDVQENAYSTRLDLRLNDAWSTYVRVFHDQGLSTQPEGVSGRVVRITDNPSNAVWQLQGLFSRSMLNELKVGYNAAPTRINGIAPVVNGVDWSNITVNISGSVANSGIAGQGASSGISIPGGLVRSNSATNGRGQPYDPYSLSLVDTLSRTAGNHYVKMGGEARIIRMSTDRLGGTTYTYSNLANFLSNTLQQVQYLGDVSAPSVFNNGAAGPRHTVQNYYIGYAQDEWRLRQNLTMNYGFRYEYYTPMTERDDLIVKYNVDTGTIDPSSTAPFKSRKTNVLPRFAMTWSPSESTLLRGGVGVYVGPGQPEDQIQPIESDRVSSTITGGTYPLDIPATVASFQSNPNNRNFQPRAYTNNYLIPERIYQYTTSIQQQLPGRFVLTAAYVGSQGRNLFLRSVTNQITGLIQTSPTANAIVVRQWDLVQPDGVTVLRPFAEIDVKTSGGRDSYNAMQLQLTRRAGGVTMNTQYTLGRSFGNTGGSNEALTAANNAVSTPDFDYDLGYNNADIRHTFNTSVIWQVPVGRGRAHDLGHLNAVVGGWDVGGILNARSGLPIDVRVTRPDVVYVESATGLVFTGPAAGRVAVVNTPGGGSSRNVRRPDLIAGADPFIKDGGLLFLNPAAFSIPKPGSFGNLQRGKLHGPGFMQFDMMASKHWGIGQGGQDVEFRIEAFNILNSNNFSNPVATLPNALPASAGAANTVQPGEPFTAGAAGTFGRLTSTVGRTVGLGTNRQMQFAFRVNF